MNLLESEACPLCVIRPYYSYFTLVMTLLRDKSTQMRHNTDNSLRSPPRPTGLVDACGVQHVPSCIPAMILNFHLSASGTHYVP